MCMAIYKPAKFRIKRKYLKCSYEGNSDGCGLAYASKNGVEVCKGLWTFEEFMSHYQDHEDKALLIHFRFATHAATDKQNCHPWPMLDGQAALIHNGVLNIKREYETLSDTGNFTRLVLEPMLRKVPQDNPSLKYLVEECIGSGNKIAVMNAESQVTIFNERHGIWHKGVWFSNEYFRKERVRYVTTWSSNLFSKGHNREFWQDTPVSGEAVSNEIVFDGIEETQFIDDIDSAMCELGMSRKEAIDYVCREWGVSSADVVLGDGFPAEKGLQW